MSGFPAIVAALWLSGFASLATAAECSLLSATGNPEYPPYLWRDPDNPTRLIGASAELLERIGGMLDLRIELRYSGPWARAQVEVRSGRIDLIAGAFRTPERLAAMDYIEPAFLQTPSVVWVERNASLSYAGWPDLRGLVGGTVLNNSFGAGFDRFARQHLQIEEVPSLQQAFGMLLAKRIDYVLYERYPGLALAERAGLGEALRTVGPAVSSEPLYLTVSKASPCNSPALRAQLAEKMTELVRADVPKALLRKNIDRWREQRAAAAED